MGNFDGERTPIILCLPCFQRSLCALSKTVVVGIWKRRGEGKRFFQLPTHYTYYYYSHAPGLFVLFIYVLILWLP